MTQIFDHRDIATIAKANQNLTETHFDASKLFKQIEPILEISRHWIFLPPPPAPPQQLRKFVKNDLIIVRKSFNGSSIYHPKNRYFRSGRHSA